MKIIKSSIVKATAYDNDENIIESRTSLWENQYKLRDYFNNVYGDNIKIGFQPIMEDEHITENDLS